MTKAQEVTDTRPHQATKATVALGGLVRSVKNIGEIKTLNCTQTIQVILNTVIGEKYKTRPQARALPWR